MGGAQQVATNLRGRDRRVLAIGELLQGNESSRVDRRAIPAPLRGPAEGRSRRGLRARTRGRVVYGSTRDRRLMETS
jgi:hypothetical protein